MRARNRHPVARLASQRCHSRPLLLLTQAQARRAMAPVARRLTGKATALELARISRVAFNGYTEWEQAAKAGGRELCELEMVAELVAPGTVRVDPTEPSCEPI